VTTSLGSKLNIAYELTREYLCVPWNELGDLLHVLSEAQVTTPEVLVNALLASGAPDWVRSSAGFATHEGWCINAPDAAGPRDCPE
jgi:hypothetical protein